MPGPVFPWRDGNQFELLVDGPEFFPVMLAAIERAERQVDLELYLVEAGACAQAVVEALEYAASRGVRVRCLFDAYGALAFATALRQRLHAAGVELRLYNPLHWRRGLRNLYRDHRKLLLVDEQWAAVGGTGVTDEFWTPGHATSEWHEVMVRIDRKSVNCCSTASGMPTTAAQPGVRPKASVCRACREYLRRARAWAGWPTPMPASTATSCARWCAP